MMAVITLTEVSEDNEWRGREMGGLEIVKVAHPTCGESGGSFPPVASIAILVFLARAGEPEAPPYRPTGPLLPLCLNRDICTVMFLIFLNIYKKKAKEEIV